MKWTKKDIKAVAQALVGFHLTNRLWIPGEVLRVRVEANAAAVASSELDAFAAMLTERAQKNEDAARHFERHPSIYGDATPEMIARFDGLAKEDQKSADKARALAARVRAEGAPADALEIYRQTTL